MSKRTETFTKTAIFCDEAGRRALAYGPCMNCGKDLCRGHGETSSQAVHIGEWLVPICPKCRSETTMEQLIMPIEHFDKQWKLYRRQEEE